MEKPIIFAPEMVRATLDGHKTQTRQVLKPQPKWAIQNEGDKPEIFKNMYGQVDAVWYSPTYYPVNDGADFDFDWDAEWVKCPYAPGDILWVRETWAEIETPDKTITIYKADRNPLGLGHTHFGYNGKIYHIKWRPSIHMPRSIARLFLLVKNIRTEQLQDITHDDAVAEGVIEWIRNEYKSGSYLDNAMRGAACAKPERAFALLWDSLNAKRGHPWSSNPWVWVIEFEQTEVPYE